MRIVLDSHRRVELVVAVCNEPKERIDALVSFASNLREAAMHTSMQWNISICLYCKCREHVWCNKHLPNVGREGHTYLEHLVHAYDELADVTVFINPGTGSKATLASAQKTRIADAVMRDTMQALIHGKLSNSFWSDGQGKPSFAPAASEVTPLNESLAQTRCRAEADALCSATSRTHCPLALGLPCERQCGCNDPGVCRWSGSTATNVAWLDGIRVATNESTLHDEAPLPSARPSSFTHWACKHLVVSPSAFRRCRWAPTATFAVGSVRVHRHPARTYAGISHELTVAGFTGGVAVHYMERLWRSLFACGGNRRT